MPERPLSPEEVDALESFYERSPILDRPIDEKCKRLLATVRDREKQALCDICAGDKSMTYCACGGTGLAHHAIDTFRTELFKARMERDELQRQYDEERKFIEEIEQALGASTQGAAGFDILAKIAELQRQLDAYSSSKALGIKTAAAALLRAYADGLCLNYDADEARRIRAEADKLEKGD